MNAYNQLVHTAQSLEQTEILGREESPSSEEIRQFLQANQLRLDTAREALKQGCFAEFELSAESYAEHMCDARLMRDLALSFRVELAAAEQDGRMTDAVRTGVNALDLAGAVRRGGLVVDLLIGVAISGISVDALRRLRHRLTMNELQLLMRELQRVESEREPVLAIITRDEDWDRRFPPEGDFDPSEMGGLETDDEETLDEDAKQAIIEALIGFSKSPIEEQRQTRLDTDNRDLAVLRLLTIESALLASRLASGGFPESLGALEREFLPVVPLDPYTDEPFCYRNEGEDFVLYSVGPSREDGGGRMGSWIDVTYAGADLFLDASDCDEP